MKKAKCKTSYCRGRRGKRMLYCSKCNMRKYRALNKVRYAYTQKKAHAKEKGIVFTISFEEYKEYWVDGGTIDRKENDKGYIPGNIQQLSREANASKGAMKYSTWRQRQKDLQDACPF